jgi:hypothetical protein
LPCKPARLRYTAASVRVSRLFGCVLALAAVLQPPSASAQTPASNHRRLELFGYLQTQLERTRVDGDAAHDRVFFRRIVLGLHATPTRTWTGHLGVDLGPIASSSSNRVLVKDAFLQYSGLARKGLTLSIGNQKVPFSRSMLTPSQRRSLVERPFTGEKSFGSPGRLLGIKAEGWHAQHTLYWSAAAGSSLQSPDVRQIRIDSVAEAHGGWNPGILTTGRIEVHPSGETPRDQGSFGQPLRYTVGAAVWHWQAHSRTGVPADRSGGLEVSGGLRGGAVSLDAEYERIAGHTADADVTTGLYRGGVAHLEKLSFEGGYIVRRRVELLGAWDRLLVAAYRAAPHRTAAGVNWYLARRNVKMQVMHREIENAGGVLAAHARVTYLQAQVMF